MKGRLLILTMLLMLTGLSAFAQTVTGKVTSMEDGSPLPGVSVLIKGTTTGTSTDVDGKYSLKVPDIQNSILVFSFVGFLPEEIEVGGRSVVDVSLAPDVQQLNEIVVTALGIQRDQKALGYSVSRINSEDITAAGNTNFASALYGKAPGVKITTAPGGASSAVNVQIRGINSLNYNSQPLYVVDGILIRDNSQAGVQGVNNNGYWSDTKIRGNGILDINPEDIESLTVLKGASATALYGSEAASGVIVITTKKGTKKPGLGVDVNYTYTMEEAAFLPKFQNVYGPGYDRETNLAVGADEDGWIDVDLNGDGEVDAKRPNYRAYGQFGPKMDGQMVPWWDGEMRPYSAQKDNFKDFYQKGYSSIFNAAISNQTDKAAYRLSYTRMDYESIARGSYLDKNTFNINSTLFLNSKLSADIVINYVNSKIHNRPEQINRVTANYGGFFSRADDMSVYLDKFQTSDGYKYVLYNQDYNPDERLAYNIRASDVLEYFWRNIKNSQDEFQDRLISSVTLNYDITNNLRFRGRVGNDFTSLAIETKEYNQYPTVFNSETNSTGYYGVSDGRYSIFYGDALLTFNKDLGDFGVTVSGGFQGRNETYRDQSLGTRDGLVIANWFSLSNSTNTLNGSGSRGELMKYAYLGIANLSYKDFLFLEGTARQEYSSTLPGNKSFFYPSVNAGFVFSDAFTMPSFIDFGKIRASYGVVGNAPPRYVANTTYSQNSLQTPDGSVPELSAKNEYGNDNISPEQKYETEFGVELRTLHDRLGFDFTYYNSRIKDQILQTSLAPSSGASSILYNIGELKSNGVELGIDATPLVLGNFRWNTRFSFAANKTRVEKLNEGMNEIVYYNADAGAVKLVAEEGELLGNIYVHPRQTDENGNFVIDENGLYLFSEDYVKAGNVLPKAIGGFANTFSYKGFALDVMVDYRFGGKLVSSPLLYAYGAGMYEETLDYRDEEHGGLPYYIDETSTKVLLPSHTSAAPDGGKVYHDGILLDGVTASGEENTTIVDAASYYLNTYTWAYGWYEDKAVYDNSYVKMREVTLTYQIPSAFAQKIKFQKLSVSLIGRNLFYFYRTLKNLDPEAPIGSSWARQGIDEGSMAANRSYGFSIRASF